ncbi:hypothetical protein E3T55_14705 [Cryobacterium frigoriphilum]|uniref:Metal ABC transporter permease n=1 Tax=Cryobacterium frigoriphilum TaxID=1259150 RepID=A0A4R8ZWF8_9MICO|nr:hypothetical protein E3T55_14705 [Cryobacterium frigoriphilum]
MGYFAQALLAAVTIGALSGLVGTLVVLRRRTFFAQALTHATFPGSAPSWCCAAAPSSPRPSLTRPSRAPSARRCSAGASLSARRSRASRSWAS